MSLSTNSILNPSNSFAVLPFTMFLLSFRGIVDSLSVLLSFVPVTDIFSAIGPLEGPLALFHVIDVLANVLPSIGPRERPVSLHLVVYPISVEDSPI